MKVKNIVLEEKNCSRCNANARIVVKPDNEFGVCMIIETCDKCKLHKIIRTAHISAWKYYWQLSYLYALKERNPENVNIDESVAYLKGRINILELGLNP